MSLPAQNPAQQVVAAAGQTVIPFSWRCDDPATVVVWVGDVLTGGFTVQLNADQTASPGGTVTLIAPSALNDMVTVERTTPQTSAAAFSAYFPFTAVALTAALDRVVELLQEFWAKMSRTFTVRRSMLTKVSSLELPLPQTNGLALGWQTDDGGAHYYLTNVIVAATVVGVVQAATMVKNEVPAGAVNSTTGSDGNGAFTLAHVPASAALLDVLVDGVRQPPARYVRVGAVVTFNATFFPIAGSDIRADYFY